MASTPIWRAAGEPHPREQPRGAADQRQVEGQRVDRVAGEVNQVDAEAAEQVGLAALERVEHVPAGDGMIGQQRSPVSHRFSTMHRPLHADDGGAGIEETAEEIVVLRAGEQHEFSRRRRREFQGFDQRDGVVLNPADAAATVTKMKAARRLMGLF